MSYAGNIVLFHVMFDGRKNTFHMDMGMEMDMGYNGTCYKFTSLIVHVHKVCSHAHKCPNSKMLIKRYTCHTIVTDQ